MRPKGRSQSRSPAYFLSKRQAGAARKMLRKWSGPLGARRCISLYNPHDIMPLHAGAIRGWRQDASSPYRR